MLLLLLLLLLFGGGIDPIHGKRGMIWGAGGTVVGRRVLWGAW
jgi:hypothetical protein